MTASFPRTCEVQNVVREYQRMLSNASTAAELGDRLNRAFSVLMSSAADQSGSHSNEEFTKRHYARFIEGLLRPPIIGFYPTLDAQAKDNFEAFFLQGVASDSFLVLGSALSANSEHVKPVTVLLEKFIEASRLSDLFLEQCLNESADNSELKKPGFLRNQILTLIVSMPDRVANKLRLHTSSLFHPDVFITKVAKCIIGAISSLHTSSMETPKQFSLKFLSELLGRLCMAGHGKRVLTVIIPAIEEWMSTSPFWLKLCSNLFTGIPDNTLEHVIGSLLKETPNSSIINKLFGNTVTTHPRLKFLLTTKFLLLRYYEDPRVLVNIISYLATVNDRQILMATIKVLFENWSNKSALKHTPYDHHLYISCALVHTIGYLSKEERGSLKHEMLNKLLTGVQVHLDSPLEKVRQLGMVIAECLTGAFEPDGEKLSFDYVDNKESKMIKEFAKGPDAQFAKTKTKVEAKKVETSKNTPEGSISNGAAKKAGSKRNDDDDSDDDLVPYDIDEEDLEKSKSPKHLRDCLEGLLESEKPEKTEAALQAVEKLVCTDPDDLNEVCVELVKILLHLQDQYSTENFQQLRHGAMVAIATRCPVEIAGYLTEEFFCVNYNISQRLDMLNVLSATAQVLSEPKEISKEKSTPKKFPMPRIEDYVSVKMIPEWQRIVQERVEAKTTRFAKGPTKPPPKQVVNKFSKVAGHFFYPLMKNFDCKLNTLDLLGEDCFVLGRLLHTLGVIMYAARGTPGARTMGAALIEFTWALRYHPDAYICQVLVFAQVMVFVSVPASVLFDDCSNELLEIHHWLKDLVQKDSNMEVKQIALQALAVLEETFKSEFTGVSS